MPNFLLIGAEKSGTTSLYYYLEQHPEVYMSPIKGPNFFAFEGRQPDFRGPSSRNTVTDLEVYGALFAGVADETAVGVSGESKEVSESSSFGGCIHPRQGFMIRALDGESGSSREGAGQRFALLPGSELATRPAISVTRQEEDALSVDWPGCSLIGTRATIQRNARRPDNEEVVC